MKKSLVFVVLVLVFGFSTAYADPRMEINDNFCHFLHNNNDEDDETFVAGCAAQISVLQGIAQGFARVVVEGVPANFDEVTAQLSIPVRDAVENGGKTPPGQLKKQDGWKKSASLVITNATYQDGGSDLRCTMVESNGTAYTSQNWVSKITFRRQHRLARTGTLIYQLRCINGEQ